MELRGVPGFKRSPHGSACPVLDAGTRRCRVVCSVAEPAILLNPFCIVVTRARNTDASAAGGRVRAAWRSMNTYLY